MHTLLLANSHPYHTSHLHPTLRENQYKNTVISDCLQDSLLLGTHRTLSYCPPSAPTPPVLHPSRASVSRFQASTHQRPFGVPLSHPRFTTQQMGTYKGGHPQVIVSDTAIVRPDEAITPQPTANVFQLEHFLPPSSSHCLPFCFTCFFQ
ncbi:hypothetical protein ElyMa_005480400 [Elysia marginata]|uniref:Uncharacterized protein n=1 Tax=Elysia marginata TaxID=1093978 RepID=A0AAV4EQM0_9GAST|nr:hypothetical protein ElyMa_005480400 [Elysia marginata]